MLTTLAHHRFSVADYDRMVDSGILTEEDRVELIRGEIIDKMTIGDPHSGCVNRLNRVFGRLTGENAVITVQNPIRLDDSVPEPDITVSKPRDDFYSSGKPGPDDILLLIEVADSSLEFDRTVKGPLYAEAGIREYWIVNLIDDCVEVHRDPRPDGTWGDVRTLRRGDRIDLVALPDVTVAITDAIG